MQDRIIGKDLRLISPMIPKSHDIKIIALSILGTPVKMLLSIAVFTGVYVLFFNCGVF
jgi:hypothetical protein